MIQFKNYTASTLEFPHLITCITGRNGSGKTNLLDAVYYLCYTKSYFTSTQQNCVQNGKDGFRITGYFNIAGNSDAISAKWRLGKKELFYNDMPYEKINDHIGKFSAVMIAPDDIELINGASEGRRKWLDGILCQLDKSYFEKLLHYTKILIQRNAWLKLYGIKPKQNDMELDYYNSQLAADSRYIFAKRNEFFVQFQPILINYYSILAQSLEAATLSYKSELFEKPLENWLNENLEQDLRAQRTLHGIHKDDIIFQLDDKSLKSFGSQGQKKSFLFAIKLAQFSYLKNSRGDKPILLLDDIFEKLDQSRVEALMKILRNGAFGQVILTDTHHERVLQAFGKGTDISYIDLNNT